MKVVLLHKDVYMPEWIQGKVNVVMNKYKDFELSKHVIDHAIEDEDKSHGYTLDKLQRALTNLFYSSPKEVEAFEVELTNFEGVDPRWLITKICLRTSYSPTQDVCLSIRAFRDFNTKKFDTSKALIVTAWLNHKKDSHFTLDNSKYITEEEFVEIGKEYNKQRKLLHEAQNGLER